MPTEPLSALAQQFPEAWAEICALLHVPDDLDGIYGAIKDNATLRNRHTGETLTVEEAEDLCRTVEATGRLLFEGWLLPFEVTSLLLIIASVGAVTSKGHSISPIASLPADTPSGTSNSSVTVEDPGLTTARSVSPS